MLRQVKAKCALEGRTMRSLTLLFFQDWLGDGPSTAALLAAEGTGVGTSAPVPADSRKKVRVRDLPMIGMWRDRDDMSDPAAFVRGLRKNKEEMIFGTAMEHSLVLCSANQKHFKDIEGLQSIVFRP